MFQFHLYVSFLLFKDLFANLLLEFGENLLLQPMHTHNEVLALTFIPDGV